MGSSLADFKRRNAYEKVHITNYFTCSKFFIFTFRLSEAGEKSTEENRIEAGITETVQPETGVPEESQAPEEAGKDLAEPIEVGISEGNLEGKALNAECPFVYGDSEWKLQTFVPEDMLIDGELAMDDRVNFLIQAVCGEESYVLFDEMVHIGVPVADVFIDQQEQLHIILRDVRTAKYRVTDFVYDAENKKFIGKDALNEDAINYIGTTGR